MLCGVNPEYATHRDTKIILCSHESKILLYLHSCTNPNYNSLPYVQTWYKAQNMNFWSNLNIFSWRQSAWISGRWDHIAWMNYSLVRLYVVQYNIEAYAIFLCHTNSPLFVYWLKTTYKFSESHHSVQSVPFVFPVSEC